MGIFFVSWELWQQMTFVLAMGIVVVFCMGLVKLWWSNRIMKKQEIIDEEKRARMTDMRRAGLAVKEKRGNEIPFGVRAIQSGVEVAGIWISRPASPNLDQKSTKLTSTTTLVGLDTTADKKGKLTGDTKPMIASIPNLNRTASDASIFQRLTDSDSLASTPSISPPISQFASQTQKYNPRTAPVLSVDTLRKLETHAGSKHAIETYMPTSVPRNPRRPSQRSSGSSSGGESMDSQPHSTRSASGRSYTSSRSSRLYTSRHFYDNRLNYSNLTPESPGKESRDPFDTPARTPSGLSAFSQATSDYRTPLRESPELSAPEPTFGPGDLHVNRKSRRPNPGFEVLPAGTFGLPQELLSNANMERQEVPSYKTKNRLRKKSRSPSSRGGPTF